MRLLHIEFNDSTIVNVDIGFIGVPMDNGS